MDSAVEREAVERTADEAVDFVFKALAKALGLADWQVHDGTDTWGGDVEATLYGILHASRAVCPSTGHTAVSEIDELLDWARERDLLDDQDDERPTITEMVQVHEECMDMEINSLSGRLTAATAAATAAREAGRVAGVRAELETLRDVVRECCGPLVGASDGGTYTVQPPDMHRIKRRMDELSAILSLIPKEPPQ